MRIGFITWDGPAQNYMESLFLPIFARVAAQRDDTTFSTLQFTWDFDTTSIEQASRDLGFGYEAHPVIRRPLKPATAIMIALGARRVVEFARRERIDVLMPRSIICAAMVLAARKRLPGIRIVFDADGFVADERVDFAGWSSKGITYRLFRDIESQMARVADSCIVRTRRAREILTARAGSAFDPNKVIVVSNGKNEDDFAPLDKPVRDTFRAEMNVPADAPWVVYAGSLGPQYHPEEMLEFFGYVREARTDARFLCLTGQVGEMQALVDTRNMSDCVDVRRVPPDDVPRCLASADVGLALREPTFSQAGVAPIKVGEYLLCGLPLVATRGVGDVDDQVDDTVGFLLDGTDADSLKKAAEWFTTQALPNRETYRKTCRQRGLDEFSMESCAQRYVESLEVAVFGSTPRAAAN